MMGGISSDVLGEIILKTVLTFPDLFTGNYTLGQVLSAVRSNDTFLQIIVNSTGLDKQSVINTVDTYLAIAEYLKPTAAPTTAPSQNISENNTICKDYVNPGVFTSFSLLPSLLIILILSCLSQRKRSFSCFGRTITKPGLCIPVNLVDSYENRFAFACAFGATTTKCLSILFYGGNDEIYDPETIRVIEDPSNPSWLGIAWKILAMVVIGLAYYPLFACMSTDYRITGFVMGFLYSLLWVIMNVAQFVNCPVLTSVVFPYDNFFLELPVTLCLVYLTLRYFVLMVKAIHRRCTRRRCIMTEEEEDWRTSYKYRYVVKLLKPVPKELKGDEAGLRGKVKEKLYKWKPEFKYSTRVVCTYFISFIGVYEVLVIFVIVGGIILRIMQGIDEIEVQGVLGISGVKEILLIASVSVFVAVGITGICSIILVANMLSWYRGHLFRLQRGEKDFLPVQLFTKNPSSITVATLKYCGFQVAYMIWAATILIVTLGVIGFVVGQQLILPMANGSFDSFLWNRVKNLWPAILISVAFFAVQLLLSKFVFMMDRGKTLALNNRRLFHVCTFFLFFFNIFLGVVSCLRRIIIGAVLGVMFLGRLQKSVIPRDYELMDPGFNAYVGYLILEHTHANPVLVTFCQLLIKSVTDRQESEVGLVEENCGIENHEKPSGEKGTKLKGIRQRKFTRIRNRWQLLLTLHNNPSIQEDRRSELFQVKSAFAAIQVMIGRTLVQQLDHEERSNDEEIKDEDSKL